MSRKVHPSFLTLILLQIVLQVVSPNQAIRPLAAEDHIRADRAAPATNAAAVMWQHPGDIRTRDLFHGPGGKEKAPPPQGPYTFLEEDTDGNSPKFTVVDGNGARWKIKLGEEVGPEIAATRLVWAVGYFADEDYFLPRVDVRNMPIKLSRGNEFVREGTVVNVRLERERDGDAEPWKWRKNPFQGTREFNGLRVMAVLLNGWDLKDTNNVLLRKKDGGEQIFFLGDLGSTFGSTGSRWPGKSPKGDLVKYSQSDFITKVTPEHVSFKTPTRPMSYYLMVVPIFMPRTQTGWIGREIPLEDVRWIADLLEQLSPAQIRDAFRAGGYSPEEAEGFAQVVETRIAALNGL